jgi:hypothetical protein
MTRVLVIFIIALVPILVILNLTYQAYEIQLSLTGTILRTLGGVVAAAFVARRIDRMLGGAKRKPGKPPPAIYHRMTPDQQARLSGKPPEAPPPPEGEAAPDTSSPSAEPQSLRDRLLQQQTKRD